MLTIPKSTEEAPTIIIQRDFEAEKQRASLSSQASAKARRSLVVEQLNRSKLHFFNWFHMPRFMTNAPLTEVVVEQKGVVDQKRVVDKQSVVKLSAISIAAESSDQSFESELQSTASAFAVLRPFANLASSSKAEPTQSTSDSKSHSDSPLHYSVSSISPRAPASSILHKPSQSQRLSKLSKESKDIKTDTGHVRFEGDRN